MTSQPRLPTCGGRTEMVDDPSCKQLMLRSDTVSWPQGRTRNISKGSFGAVYPVKLHGFTCIAKRLHDVLREAGPDDAAAGESSVSEKFIQECKILSTLHHPNIVQFMGIHKATDSSDPMDVSLVMEGLYMDLEEFIENHNRAKETVPLFLQLSFLLDTGNALVYLHKHTPPIIHRDVKAANILLARDMRAKLADLGTSKLLNFNPLSSTKFTSCPGTIAIMPPEALQSYPNYDTKLDVFSFGTLILHIINQQFPLPCEVDKAKKKGEFQITKRQAEMDMLHSKHPRLHELTRKCLQDAPGKRPDMKTVRDEMDRLSMQHPCTFTTFYDMHKETEKLKREVKAIELWSSRMERLQMENSQLQAELKMAKDEIELAETQAAVFKDDFDSERRDRERAAGEYDTDKRRLEAEKEELRRELQYEKATRIRLQNENAQLREQERGRGKSRPAKTTGSRSSATLPVAVRKKTTLSYGSGFPASPQEDLLQSLRFDSAQHSSGGQRCSQRYEWYQTPSEVVLDIMIPNVKDNDVLVEFTDQKVKVFIDTGDSPYRLSLHTCHTILPDKCLVKCLKTKVELKLKKAEGIQWTKLDERGTPPKAYNSYFQKWDLIPEKDVEP